MGKVSRVMDPTVESPLAWCGGCRWGTQAEAPTTCLCPYPHAYPGQVPTSAQRPGQHCPQSQ